MFDAAAASSPGGSVTPLDEDERFVVGLVLSYYRRDPLRARLRLLQLIGEALQAQSSDSSAGKAAGSAPASSTAPSDPDAELWSKTRSGIAPLKRKR